MQPTILTEEQVDFVLDNFTFKKDAAEYLKCSVYTLDKNLQRYGKIFPYTNFRKGKRFSYEFVDKQWLIDNWINTNLSLKTLSKKYNIPLRKLESRAIDFNLSKRYLYPLNNEKLFNLSDPHVWYLAGLVATDGYVPKGRNTIELALKGEDEKDLLLDIYKYFELTSPILYRDDITRIRITTNGLNEFLYNNFSITDGPKTFNVGVPLQINNEDYAKAYIRGCLDGDGSIRKKRKFSWSILTASDNFIEGICDILNTYLNTTHTVVYDKYPKVGSNGKKGKLVLDWIYSLENCFYLKRKYNIYKQQVNDIV